MKKLTISQFPPLSYAGQEAINALCTNLTFSGDEMKKIMITSTHAAEGKSSIAMNIMRTMAKYGKSIVLVDADLRMSSITSSFRVTTQNSEKMIGLAHLLAGMEQEGNVVYETNIQRAYMVPVGKTVSTPMSLLNSARLNQLLNNLADVFDYVLIDAPPVGEVIDAAEIAKSCDGILVVVAYNDVHYRELLDVKFQLEQTKCPVIGAVLNMVDTDDYTGRKYYNHYYVNRKKETPEKERTQKKRFAPKIGRTKK